MASVSLGLASATTASLTTENDVFDTTRVDEAATFFLLPPSTLSLSLLAVLETDFALLPGNFVATPFDADMGPCCFVVVVGGGGVLFLELRALFPPFAPLARRPLFLLPPEISADRFVSPARGFACGFDRAALFVLPRRALIRLLDPQQEADDATLLPLGFREASTVSAAFLLSVLLAFSFLLAFWIVFVDNDSAITTLGASTTEEDSSTFLLAPADFEVCFFET